jgi:hypothetical protein
MRTLMLRSRERTVMAEVLAVDQVMKTTIVMKAATTMIATKMERMMTMGMKMRRKEMKICLHSVS